MHKSRYSIDAQQKAEFGKPIIFSTPMVQAILEGRKIMTRRIVKPQPKISMVDARLVRAVAIPLQTEYVVDDKKTIRCPYGVPGDRLWVRETFLNTGSQEYLNKITGKSFVYKADCGDMDRLSIQEAMCDLGWKWKPSIFMPHEACRIFLEITDVKVERLNNISEPDAKREGVIPDMATDHPSGYLYRFPFLDLWNKINAKCSWKSNPWVWVITFKRITKGI